MSLLLATLTNAPEDCPQKCSCTPEVTEIGPAIKVQCSHKNLKSVPIMPNTTLHIRVSLLDVSFNYLYTLEDNTFFQYESVNYIYLQHCKLNSTSEKTFQRLENLIYVDLSNNLLTSIPPNLFNNNQKLDTLILGNNDLSNLQLNTPILNGPFSLSVLDLHSCKLSNISSVTFSSLLNLTEIDISKNKLTLLNFDTLSAHQKLQDVNLENNLFECGLEFQTLWNAMQNKTSLVHKRVLTCRNKNGKLEIWRPTTPSPLDRPMTTPSVTPSYKSDTNESTAQPPSTTLPDMPNTNTNPTLNSSATPSNKSDVSTNTTENPTTPPEEGNDTNYLPTILKILVPVFFLSAAAILAVCICRKHYGTRGVRNGNKDSAPNEQNSQR